MKETLYELRGSEGLIASNMSLVTAAMLAIAYMQKYHAEPELMVTIKRMREDEE